MTKKPYIFVYQPNLGGGAALKRIKFDHIIQIIAIGDYCKVVISDKDQYVVHIPLKTILEFLPEEQFCRCHRSHIVNVDIIDRIQDDTIYTDISNIPVIEIPIGALYKKELLQKINYVHGTSNRKDLQA
jgi:DNA-binding LytR/AlgR family response regulator